MASEFSEIFLGGDPVPVGYRNGALVSALRVTGRDPDNGELAGDLSAQLTGAYGNLAGVVAAAGGNLDNVAQVSFYLADFADRSAINEGWVTTFPDAANRPTYKFMAAALPPGEQVSLSFHAVLGARRESIELAGVAHTNPIPLAVRIGEFLFTSRILPYDPATGAPPGALDEQVRHLFVNAAAVLAAAGMNFGDVVQARGFIAEAAKASLIAAPFRERAGAEVPLHIDEYRAGELKAMLELIARRRP